MSKYTPNTLIQNRYLLVELISYDGQSGRQVWAVKDNQTGKRMIGRFQQNGTVEWFDDNRPQVSSSKLQPPRKPSVPVLPQPTPGVGRMKPYYPILIIFGAAILVIGYYKKDRLVSFFKAKNGFSEQLEIARSPEAIDSATVYVEGLTGIESDADAASHRVEMPSIDTLMEERNEPESRSPKYLGDRSARKSEIKSLINKIGKQTQEKDRATFARLTELMNYLKLDDNNGIEVDSLYIVMAGRGATCIHIYEKNGDNYLKRSALEWYRLAYILKPSPLLNDRINRLAAKPDKTSNGRKVQSDENVDELFLKDPELK